VLVLCRKLNETISIGKNAEIKVTVAQIKGDKVTLALEAPPEVGILRKELLPGSAVRNGRSRQPSRRPMRAETFRVFLRVPGGNAEDWRYFDCLKGCWWAGDEDVLYLLPDEKWLYFWTGSRDRAITHSWSHSWTWGPEDIYYIPTDEAVDWLLAHGFKPPEWFSLPDTFNLSCSPTKGLRRRLQPEPQSDFLRNGTLPVSNPQDITAPPPAPIESLVDLKVDGAQDASRQSQASKATSASAFVEWTTADGPSQWGKVFGVSARTFLRRVKDGKIRAKKLSNKSYLVAIEDLPTKHQAKFRLPTGQNPH
jgi:carbon storage regulator CsrA